MQFKGSELFAILQNSLFRVSYLPLGEGCLVDCSSIPMFYCDFATQKVTRISFKELQVNDRLL